MNLNSRFRGTIGALSSFMEQVGGWILLIVAIGVTINAFARYGFGADLALITEAGGFVFLVVTFLGLAGAYIAGQHVAVEILEVIGNKRFVQVMQHYVIPVISVIFMALLVIMTTMMTMRYFNTGRVTLGRYPMPFWIFMAVIPLGSLIYVFVLLSDLISRVRGEAVLANLSIDDALGHAEPSSNSDRHGGQPRKE
ncbi:TRAP transporter small permease [Aquamicrobium zhengzhouense]|uniref:TRAP transporter small permease protein n=1 Tax=Aquamicrobium zhengzhouense TaxID=2781738 RepID=A0ABS0SEE6_9HYPH|nr:TRAP transporter small permease subunit [Aquamicrobium zhengzhouense]MBI1621663.1 TRAP transporter small permease [Aquamicrobium zhengzhouense]